MSARELLRRRGLDVRRLTNIPFGVNWPDDASAILDGRVDVAFDVGANDGQTARELLRQFSEARVFSFEPHPGAARNLAALAAEEPRLEAVPAAVGAAPGQLELVLAEFTEHSTFARAARVDEQTSLVDVISVDRFCTDRGIDRVTLLKIDTEGFELEVLCGAKSMLADGRVGVIVAECDFGGGNQPHGDFFAIHELLSAHGYRVVAFYPQGVNGRGWEWGDVMYRLPDESPVRHSPFG